MSLVLSLLFIATLQSDTESLPTQPPLLDTWFRAQLPHVRAPLDADIEERWVLTYDGKRVERTEHSRGYVSADGRVRIEWVEGDAWLAWILTPAGTIALVDLKKNEAIFISSAGEDPPKSVPLPSRSPKPPLGEKQTQSMVTEQLADAVIEGRTCHGFRRRVRGIGRVNPSGEGRDGRFGTENFTVETWIAADLAQVVLETRRSEHEFVTLRLLNVKERESDPDLFVIPTTAAGSAEAMTTIAPRAK